ncbi:hypothetical protein D3C77_690810 [compost metagenome]
MRVVLTYKVDNRIKLVQLTTGQVNFLVYLRDFVEKFNVDHHNDYAGTVYPNIEDYQDLYRGRLQ